MKFKNRNNSDRAFICQLDDVFQYYQSEQSIIRENTSETNLVWFALKNKTTWESK